jgi:hypothetical protein
MYTSEIIPTPVYTKYLYQEKALWNCILMYLLHHVQRVPFMNCKKSINLRWICGCLNNWDILTVEYAFFFLYSAFGIARGVRDLDDNGFPLSPDRYQACRRPLSAWQRVSSFNPRRLRLAVDFMHNIPSDAFISKSIGSTYRCRLWYVLPPLSESHSNQDVGSLMNPGGS